MIYKKPCLRGISGEAASFCSVGTGAFGGKIILTLCDPGSTPTAIAPPTLCQNGNADANNYYETCDIGSAASAGDSCNTGNSAF